MSNLPFVQIPGGLVPHFQEYDTSQLDFSRDANLIVQRTIEFGTWNEIRWLFELYGVKRIRIFLKDHGERWLKPITFNFWRKLLGVRKWKTSPFLTAKGVLWPY